VYVEQEKREVLEAGLSFEVAMFLFVYNNDYGRAEELLTKRTMRDLAGSWSAVNSLSRNERREKLFTLHRVADLKVSATSSVT
jgi:hypothetical protein